MYLLNKQFWIATAERAIKTFVQALIAAFGVGQISGAVGVDVAAIDWRGALSLAFSAALLSVLMSVGSGPIGPVNSPSVIPVGAGPVPAVAAVIADAVVTAVNPAAATAATTATTTAPPVVAAATASGTAVQPEPAAAAAVAAPAK